VDLNWLKSFLNSFLWAFENSLVQSIATIVICLPLGLFLSFGFLLFQNKKKEFLRLLCLIPLVLPSLFSVLVAFKILPIFPFGHLGVIIAFCLIYLGFCTIFLADSIEAKISNYAVTADIYNFSSWQFLFRVLLPLIKKDLLILTFIIFAGCFSSFTVPLLVGGGKGTNLEVLIYEKIFIDLDWIAACLLALLQGLLLFAMSFYLNRTHKAVTIQFKRSRFLSSKISAGILLALICVYLGAFTYQLVEVLFDENFWSFFWTETKSEVLQALLHSTLLFFIFSILFSLFFLWICYRIYKQKRLRFLNIFLRPSTMIIGFLFYLLLPVNSFYIDLLKVTLAFTVLYGVGLFRSYLSGTIDSLDAQILVVRCYGISFKCFMQKIAYPLLKKNYIFVMSLIFLISLSDFAVIKATGAQMTTFGTLIESYLGSYRMMHSYVFAALILVLWAIFYFILRIVHVDRKKS